ASLSKLWQYSTRISIISLPAFNETWQQINYPHNLSVLQPYQRFACKKPSLHEKADIFLAITKADLPYPAKILDHPLLSLDYHEIIPSHQHRLRFFRSSAYHTH